MTERQIVGYRVEPHGRPPLDNGPDAAREAILLATECGVPLMVDWSDGSVDVWERVGTSEAA
jgi:hypothetical protein